MTSHTTSLSALLPAAATTKGGENGNRFRQQILHLNTKQTKNTNILPGTQIFFLDEKPDLRANQVFPLVFDGLRVKGYKVKIISINTASINTLRSSDVRAEGFLYKDHFMKEVMREHQELDVDDKIFLVNFQIIRG